MYIMYIYNQYSLFFFFFLFAHVTFSRFILTFDSCSRGPRQSIIYFHAIHFSTRAISGHDTVKCTLTFFILSHVIRIIITLWNPRDHKVGVLFLCTGLPCSDLHTRDPDVQVHRFAVRRETCSRWASVHERKRRKEKPTLQILTEALLYIQYTR